MAKKKQLFRFLDTVGNGTGTKNAVGDYSDSGLGQTVFKIAPQDGVYELTRLIVTIKDTQGVDSDFYGNNITLTNGIEVQYWGSQGLVVDMTDGIPIMSNGDWKRYCYDVAPSQFGTGNDIVSVRWTFGKTGMETVLRADEGDELRIILHDDFRGLIEHYFEVQGVERPLAFVHDQYE